MMRSEDIARKLCELEIRENLFEDRIAGVAYWHLVREYFLVRVIRPGLLKWGDAHPDMLQPISRRHGLRRRIQEASELIQRISTALKYWRMKWTGVDVLFSLSPRTVRMPNGDRQSQYIDFFASGLKSSYAVLSLPGMQSDEPPRYKGRPLVMAIPLERLRQSADTEMWAAVGRESRLRAEHLAEELFSVYGVKINIEAAAETIAEVIRLRAAIRPWARKFLRELKVRCLVTVVGYSLYNMILTELAREEGLNVLELQHGTVYPGHAAYNLPLTRSPYLPDYMLCWGKFWQRATANCSLMGLIDVGYPFFEYFARCRRQLKPAQAVRTILFVSQGTIGADLVSVALEMSERLPPVQYRLLYKMHPSEARSWRQLYPKLAASSIMVEDGSSRNIYECFESADVVVGVYSTAIIECVAWGIRAYSLRWIDGSDSVQEFVEAGYLRYVDSIGELVADVMNDAGDGRPMSYDDLWVPDSAVRVSGAIDRFVGERKGVL